MTKHTKKSKTYIYIVFGLILVIVGAYMLINGGMPEGSLYTEKYIDSEYNFSINYPEGFSTSTLANPAGEGEVVLIQKVATTSMGMQIVISSFNEPLTTSITADRIHTDAPNLTIIDPKDVVVGDIGKGISFIDGDSSTAQFQEWFVANDVLYQVSAPKVFSDTAQSIIGTWKFDTQ